MPSTYSTSLRLEQQADGENSGTWGQKQNNNHVLLESALSGGASAGVAVGGAVDVTLTASNGLTDQSRQGILRLTGVLTAAINVIVPAAATATKWWFVSNETTGAFALTFKTFAGTGIVVPQGVKTILWCDGTNIVEGLRFNTPFAVDTGASGTAFVVTPGGTTPSNLSAGMRIMFKAAHAASGGASTLNFAGFGTTSFTRLDTTALVANDFISGQLVEAGFDGTRWVLLTSPQVTLGTASAAATGTSGHTLPFLDGANTWSGVQTHSVAINEAQGADIASAGTTDIGAATGNYVKITGTTTITALGTIQAGTRRIVEFTGALTLTHNAASLILPGGASITTAAGDTATFVSEGAGNWRCVVYTTAASPAAPIISKTFTSSQIAITSAGTPAAIPHGLGVAPKFITAVLHCVTGELGYTAGDEFPQYLGATVTNAGSSIGVSVVADATNLNVFFAGGGSVFIVVNKSTGTVNSATNANWTLILRAWA